jgi:plasmid stability protein
MTNLTITTDEEVLRRARIRALEQGTSVNAVLREFLESYAGTRAGQREAIREFLEIARESNAGSGSRGRTWTRDELYDRSL